MTAKSILDRLGKKQKAGANAWLCKCPSHEDRSPSLKVTEADDGRVLIHCFAGCSTDEILGSIGLTIDDLFSEPLYHRAKPLRPGIYPRDVLIALQTEMMIVLISSFDLRKGRTLSEVDQKRLDLAYERISEAIEIAGVA